MVLNCVVPGCKNLSDKRFPIPFHKFPFTRPEILELWLEAIRRENWRPSRTSRICGKHFVSTDYREVIGGTVKLLKADAIPSNFPNHTIVLKAAPSSQPVVNEEVTNEQCSSEAMDNETSSELITQEISTQTTLCYKDLDNKTSMLRKKVKTLEEKLRRRDAKIQSMTYLLDQLIDLVN